MHEWSTRQNLDDSITGEPVDRCKVYHTTGSIKPYKPSEDLLLEISRITESDADDITCYEVTGRVALTHYQSVRYQIGTIAMTMWDELIEVTKLLLVNGNVYVALCHKFTHVQGSNRFLITTGYETKDTVYQLKDISKPLMYSKQESGCFLILNSHTQKHL